MSMKGYSLPAIGESVSNVTTDPGNHSPGERVLYAGEEYVYVYNGGGEQAIPGQGMIVSAGSGATVTVSSLTNAGMFHGVVKHATITTAAYGWLLVRGYCDNLENVMASTAVAAGDLLEPGADGDWAAHGSAVPCAKAMAATGSAGSFAAYVFCKG